MRRFLAFFTLLAMVAVCFAGCASATFTVTYDVDGNVTTEQVASGDAASCEEPDPVAGKVFDGWYTDEGLQEKYDEDAPVTSDLTLYGTWRTEQGGGNVPEQTEYIVTFVVDEIPYEVRVKEGAAASFEDPEKDGWLFSGWYTDQACTQKYDLSTPVTGALTLYAGWTKVTVPQTFVVTFDLNGGTATPAIASQSVTEGAKATRPENDPGKEGYVFVGWYKDGQLYDFDTPVNSTFTLTAQWKLYVPETPGTAQATSSAAGHEASSSTDGDVDTYWQAAAEGEATLTVDFGEMAEVRSVQQIFAASGEWDFAIEGSTDGKNWAEIATVTSQEKTDSYAVKANGFFRSVRLRVLSGGIPSSREFYIETFDLADGTNIALGMKGSADNWAAGNETEMGLDGNYSTFWCAYDGNFPKFFAVEWEYMTYVNYVEFYFQNAGTHNYEVEGRLEDGSWIKLETAADHVGQSFTLQVDREVSAVLIREFAGPGWANMAEMNVYGFKNVAHGMTPAAEDGYDVYAIGDSYLHSVVASGDTAEYSVDGTEWKPLTLADGTAEAGVQAAYVRVKEGAQAKIFATPFKTDLARYVTPTASDFSDNNHRPGIATMNPENVWVQSGDGAAGYFWCAASWGGQHTLSLDFGRVCIVEGFRYTFQDEIAEVRYKLKIELSETGDSWTTVFDNTGTGAAGRVFEGEIDSVRARYVRMTVEYVDGWTNCKNVQFYGVGAPVRSVEIR